MDNIKFAIEYLKNNSHKMIEDNNNYAVQATNIAIEALEKQIPMKPEYEDNEDGYFECNRCAATIGYTDEKESHIYCLNCGQKLDWN